MTDMNSIETFLYIYPFNSYIRRNLLYRESNFVSDSLLCMCFFLGKHDHAHGFKAHYIYKTCEFIFPVLILFLNFDSLSQSLKQFSH